MHRETPVQIHEHGHVWHKFTGLLVIAATFVLTLLIGLGISQIFSRPALLATATDATAYSLLCQVGTEKASGYVGIYALYGTLTRTPTRSAQTAVAALPTVTTTPYVSDAMATAMAALPTSAITETPTLGAYISPTPKPGDTARGKIVYNGAGACNACHDVSTGVKLVGPSLKQIAALAGSRISGEAAQVYLRESIVSPNQYVVPGYAAGVMPVSYDRTLDSQQISDLVAYMLTLR